MFIEGYYEYNELSFILKDDSTSIKFGEKDNLFSMEILCNHNLFSVVQYVYMITIKFNQLTNNVYIVEDSIYQSNSIQYDHDNFELLKEYLKKDF